ncbi:MAG: PilZ domain-containing protein, partial [Candidatus Aminicenantes bacterium]|nr:PilZ domain-containing protein [Candidatus Aminicenantes bacterium]
KVKKARRQTGPVISVPVDVNRRREWRFELPLKAQVEGTLSQGRKFREAAKVLNISSGGAYFCLNAGVVVGSKLALSIDIPKKVTEGRVMILRIGATAVRLEKPEAGNKKQGVAVRFDKDFEFVSPKSR